jgi:hypothetical protein
MSASVGSGAWNNQVPDRLGDNRTDGHGLLSVKRASRTF